MFAMQKTHTKKFMQKTHTKIYILLNLEISSRKENNFASSPDERP